MRAQSKRQREFRQKESGRDKERERNAGAEDCDRSPEVKGNTRWSRDWRKAVQSKSSVALTTAMPC